MYRLQGKTALITGAARGIGFAIARKLAESGAKVSISDTRLDAAERAAREIGQTTGKKMNDEIHYAQVDVSRSEQVRDWIGQTAARWSTIDIMVCNAGIQLNRSSLEISDDEWRQVMGVDLDGVFYCAREAGRVMVEQGKGCIITISSIAEKFGLPRRLPYGVAKSGVSALTRVLAAEWAEQGVRVNAIAPGYVETELVSHALQQGHIQQDEIVSKIPMRKMADPVQIAEAALFLATESSAYITGQVLFVDGGYSISK
ncbi:SDR family NAD(P)-dependent oxidoreductase [Paenibacillus sp. GCM10027626]|uniref:SDR family NAD(P)-dependent oxidoreductase n=1 Tax=Paenibacillus sp. GCM10027626 TaxID=3273411 RepID=UPI003626E59E